MDQSPFSAPHGLSQSTTSFIASCCQGIHQTPFSRLIRPRDGKGPRTPEDAQGRAGLLYSPLTSATARLTARSLVGSHTFPIPPAPMQGARRHSVSVLDLEQNRRGGPALSGPAPRSRPHAGGPAVLMFLSLNDVTDRLFGSDGSAPKVLADVIR